MCFAEDHADPAPPPHALTVHQLCLLHEAHALKWYRRRSGEPTRQHLNIRSVMRRFEQHAGPYSIAARINRHQVRAWLDQLAAEKLSRTYCNTCLRTLRTVVRWAVDLDYLPTSITEELRLVRALAPLRSTARESVKPAQIDLDSIEVIHKLLPNWARDVLQLQKLTGARPSEILLLKNCEVELSAPARLSPAQHKTAHRGIKRVIVLVEEAHAIVERAHRPLLPDDFVWCSPKSRSGHYTIEGYRAAIARACRRSDLKRLLPYDVRRAVAQLVRGKVGLDAAQAVLGHSDARTTEIYAPLPGGDPRTLKLALAGSEVLQ